tara:strand:+ start:3080 stop:3181 length:102 start_codon:yes stop_codon:yes gene_type:complete
MAMQKMPIKKDITIKKDDEINTKRKNNELVRVK